MSLLRTLLFIPFILAWSSQPGEAHPLGIEVLPSESASQVKLIVQDALTGIPLDKAQVSVRSLDGTSIERNGLANEKGELLIPKQDGALLAVRVQAESYESGLVMGVRDQDLKVFLNRIPENEEKTIVNGVLRTQNSLDEASRAKYGYLGIAIRTLSIQDLLYFQTDQLISPLKDTIQVFGSRKIPANVVLPKQKIFWGLGYIHLNKPRYRLPLPSLKETQLTGLMGRVKISDVKKLIGGFKLSFINRVEITHLGQTDFFIPKETPVRPFKADIALKPFHKVSVKNVPNQANVLTFALTDFLGNREQLYPTDFKVIVDAKEPSKKYDVTLRTSQEEFGVRRDVLTIALLDGGFQVSGVLTADAGSKVDPEPFLPMDPYGNPVGRVDAFPESYFVPVLENGVSVLVAEGESHSLGRAYVLPELKSVELDLTELVELESLQGVSLTQLDFGDDGPQMTELKRFYRTYAKIAEE